VICFDPLGHGVLSNISNNFGSISLVLLRRFRRSTGFLSRDDLRKPPSGDKDESPFGEEEGKSLLGVEDCEGETPFASEKGRPPSGEDRGQLMVRGERKDHSCQII
jgi:hypothetical protein